MQLVQIGNRVSFPWSNTDTDKSFGTVSVSTQYNDSALSYFDLLIFPSLVLTTITVKLSNIIVMGKDIPKHNLQNTNDPNLPKKDG